jgi:hypothetical protein
MSLLDALALMLWMVHMICRQEDRVLLLLD